MDIIASVYIYLSAYLRASQVVLVERTHLPMEETQDVGSTPGLGRSPGGGCGNPLQYSYLKNSRDRGAWSTGSQIVGHD